jgi:signal recognition particle receptor subunit beta
MVQINFAQKSVTVKIVYYGPGMSGKTTNLEIVHQRAPESNKGDLTSISTDGDRTLFFDFMPLDLGTVGGMRTQFQIYTVPGQVYYNSTRKLVLQGVDGVIFVADSSASMVEENLESLRNLEENLAEYGKNIDEIPIIIQYNKRDLPDALPVEQLDATLNRWGAPTFEAIANTGQGVFPTLKALAARVLDTIHEQTGAGGRSTAQRAPAPAAGARPQAAPPARPGHAGHMTHAATAPVPTFPTAPTQSAPRGPLPKAPQPMAPQPMAPQPMAQQPMAPQPMAPQPMVHAPQAQPAFSASPNEAIFPGAQPAPAPMQSAPSTGHPGQFPTAAAPRAPQAPMPVAPLTLSQTQHGLRMADTGIRPAPAPALARAAHVPPPVVPAPAPVAPRVPPPPAATAPKPAPVAQRPAPAAQRPAPVAPTPAAPAPATRRATKRSAPAAPAPPAPAPAANSGGPARLRPRGTAAPTPTTTKSKSTTVTIVIVAIALIAGIVIGGSVFKLL